MPEIKVGENESIESALRRFKKKIQKDEKKNFKTIREGITFNFYNKYEVTIETE